LLVESGVTSVTVAVPYLVDIISSTFPQLEVVVSTIGYVGGLAGIDQYAEAGAKRIVLDMEVNRDFSFLRTAGLESPVPLEVIVNPVCLSQCHCKYNHNCVAALGSQTAIPDIPSDPAFWGHEGIGFRKLFWSNRMTVQVVGHATANHRYWVINI